MISTIILFTLIPLTTFVSGGVISVLFKTSSAFRSIILHFAAGVIFSVVAVELLPDIVERHQPLYVIIGFALGTLLMLLVKEFAESDSSQVHSNLVLKQLPIAFVVAIGVDVFIDGLLLGIGFVSGQKAGMLLTFAIALEMFSMGMATALELLSNGISKSKTILYIVSLSSLFIVSALLGATLFQNLEGRWMEMVLSFGLSALLYLVTEELLVEAHEDEDKPLYTATFFLGFLVFLILGMMV